MTHSIAISLLIASTLMACSTPPQQSYRIGSKIYRSDIAAEAALTQAESKLAPAPPSEEQVRLLRAPMPRMPMEAINADLDDLVTVSIVFNEAGDVETVVPKSYRHQILLDAVLAVVPNWKIEPSVKDGRRIKTTVQQSFQFEAQ